MGSGIGLRRTGHGFAHEQINKRFEGLDMLTVDRLDLLIGPDQFGAVAATKRRQGAGD